MLTFLPPSAYLKLLKSAQMDLLYSVCDTVRLELEHWSFSRRESYNCGAATEGPDSVD